MRYHPHIFRLQELRRQQPAEEKASPAFKPPLDMQQVIEDDISYIEEDEEEETPPIILAY